MFIIGHRGARAVEPENTLRAIREGMKCADYTEIDARLSKDRIPVIIHDATLDRTTDGTGPVGSYTARELRKFEAGKGEKIPTLEEVCLLVTGKCGLFCEIKEQGSEEEVCSVLTRTGPKNLYIVSFHHQSLTAARSLLPSARTGLIISTTDDNLPELAANLGVQAVLLIWNLVNPDLVMACHDRGLEVVSWTLDTPAEFGKAADLGIDGLASDNPCAARRFFREK
jgi:glycerophosphoryl diester phosphodiesterase